MIPKQDIFILEWQDLTRTTKKWYAQPSMSSLRCFMRRGALGEENDSEVWGVSITDAIGCAIDQLKLVRKQLRRDGEMTEYRYDRPIAALRCIRALAKAADKRMIGGATAMFEDADNFIHFQDDEHRDNPVVLESNKCHTIRQNESNVAVEPPCLTTEGRHNAE